MAAGVISQTHRTHEAASIDGSFWRERREAMAKSGQVRCEKAKF
jgi:hypothetical protein